MNGLEYECCVCGAAYHGEGAAEGCCAEQTAARLMEAQF